MLALLVCWLGADAAHAVVVQLPNGHVVGVTLRAGVAPTSIPGARSSRPKPHSGTNGIVDYHGGPVLHSSAPYLIFWVPPGFSIPASTQSFMTRYFTDVAHDSGSATNVYGVERQYMDATGFADYQQAFSLPTQVINDTHGFPTTNNCTNVNATYYPTCITDAQLQSELSRLIGAAHLPTDGLTGAGELVSSAPIYFIVTPANVNICMTSTACADKFFCAYHSSYASGGSYVLYAAIDLLSAENLSLDPKGCQQDGNTTVVQEPNYDGADVAIGYMSHENAETITDPLLNAWWDSSTGNEIGDNCNSAATNAYAFSPTLGSTGGTGTLFDQLINGHPYYTQSEWSNGAVNCEMAPAPATLTPGFNITSGSPAVGSPVSFDPSVGAPPGGYSSVTWSFGDGATGFAPGTAIATHTYTAAGVYSVTLTAVDTLGNLATATQTVTVRTPPTASFAPPSASPLAGAGASFDASASSDPNSGGSIISYGWIFGDGTAGTGVNPSHTYASPGIYTVQLVVTDSFGIVSAPLSQQLQVLGLPTDSFTFSPAAPVSGHSVAFDGVASDPNSGGSITPSSYRWSFGDGATATGETPSHTYASSGIYTVSLKVTDSFGLSKSASESIQVAAPRKVVPGRPKPSRASLSLSPPMLSFTLTAGANAPKLRQIVIGLPKGLSFYRQGLAKGVSITSTGGQSLNFGPVKLSQGRLTITLKSPAAAIRIRIAGAAIAGPAVVAARTHRHKRKGRLKIAVIAFDAAGTRTALTLTG